MSQTCQNLYCAFSWMLRVLCSKSCPLRCCSQFYFLSNLRWLLITCVSFSSLFEPSSLGFPCQIIANLEFAYCVLLVCSFYFGIFDCFLSVWLPEPEANDLWPPIWSKILHFWLGSSASLPLVAPGPTLTSLHNLWSPHIVFCLVVKKYSSWK